MNVKQVRPTRILIVCAGNTCRSPMAEAIVKDLIGNQAFVESAGIETSDGLPATRDAVQCMDEIGLDISSHQSRALNSVDLPSYDLILAMSPSIRSILKRRGAPETIVEAWDIPDPCGRGLEEYRRVAQMLQLQLSSKFGPVGWSQ